MVSRGLASELVAECGSLTVISYVYRVKDLNITICTVDSVNDVNSINHGARTLSRPLPLAPPSHMTL